MRPALRDVALVPAAVGGVYHDRAGEEVLGEVAPALVRELVGAQGLGGVGVQDLEDRVVDGAVVLEAGVLLEVAHGAGGAVVEEAVHGAGVEAEVVEHPLELRDVGAPERGLAQVDQAPTGPVVGLDDLAPGDLAHQPVGEDAQRPLESP